MQDNGFFGNTGLPVSSIPWVGGNPTGAGKDCVCINFSKNGLEHYSCTNIDNYVCELPIVEKNTLTAN